MLFQIIFLTNVYIIFVAVTLLGYKSYFKFKQYSINCMGHFILNRLVFIFIIVLYFCMVGIYYEWFKTSLQSERNGSASIEISNWHGEESLANGAVHPFVVFIVAYIYINTC